jgi:hypothetical protein
MNKKVAVIETVGLPANYESAQTLTEHLIKNLQQEYDLSVHCSEKKYAKGNRAVSNLGAKLHALDFDTLLI